MPPKSHETDSTSISLLRRVKESDSAAWVRLVDVYGPLIYSWCKRRGLSSDEAGDVAQNVFIAVAQQIQRFHREGPGDSFRGWLRVITRNQLNQYFRDRAQQARAAGGSAAHQQFQELADNALNESAQEAGNEQSGVYQRALALIRVEFKEQTWKAFIEMAIHGRSANDVAADLGMTSGAVRQAKYAVLRRLRSEFGDLFD